MHFLVELFTGDSVAHAVLILSLVAAAGLAAGSIRVLGINLGIAGVLFVGIVFGHCQVVINPQVMDFVREFGLILFVYTIGVQVGPGFAASLKRDGLPLNLMAAAIVLIGAGCTLGISRVAHIPMPAAVGLFSGATTNTPSLGAAQSALKDMPGVAASATKMPGMGYAIAYPFGVIGIILSMIILRALFRADIQQEVSTLARQRRKSVSVPSTANVEVTQPGAVGCEIQQIPGFAESGVVVSRVLHDGEMFVAQPDMRLAAGDIVLAVGPKDKLQEFTAVVGRQSDVDLKDLPSDLVIRRIIVTRKNAIGKTVEDLDLQNRFGVAVTRVSRTDIEFTASLDVKLQYADTLLVVGAEDDIKKVAAELGNSTRRLNHTELIPIFLGIGLGVLLGSVPINFPGLPAPVKLGLAGGPLVMAIILSRIGRIGPLIWYMPISANFALREFGIVLFLACVGLRAGGEFWSTLIHGGGFVWMAWAALITVLPLWIVGLFGRYVLKLNFVSMCGLFAGSMTDPPALTFAGTFTKSDGPSVSYATVYPLVMLLRVLSAQALVLLFMR